MNSNTCVFSGYSTGPSVGIARVRADGKVERFFNHKSAIYSGFKKNPSNEGWTVLGRIKKASIVKTKKKKTKTLKLEKVFRAVGGNTTIAPTKTKKSDDHYKKQVDEIKEKLKATKFL